MERSGPHPWLADCILLQMATPRSDDGPRPAAAAAIEICSPSGTFRRLRRPSLATGLARWDGACMFTPPCPTGQEAAHGPGRYHGYPQLVLLHITQTCCAHATRARVCAGSA